MADSPVRAQIKPAAGSRTILFTATNKTVVSSIVVCPLASGQTFRIALVLSGEAESDKQYLYKDAPLIPGLSFAITLGITLLAEDSIYVYAAKGEVAFNLSGIEYS